MNSKKENMAKMISSEEMASIIKSIKLEKPKAPKYIEHIYADFIELNALLYKEEVTISDIFDLLTDIRDKNIIIDDEETETNEIASDNAERNDMINNKIIMTFDICIYRSRFFSEDEYPFEIKNNYMKLKNNTTLKQRIYLFLLISSNLNYFEQVENILTKEFELLSLHSLKGFLNTKAEVKSFGKNTNYSGNAISKIQTLANDLRVKLNQSNVDCISKYNAQERGCDIIAWMPFKDLFSNMLVFLCQCACGKEWEKKQGETELFANYFYFEIAPIHSMFIPYSLINIENKFYQRDRISNVLFFERKRIIEQLDNVDFFESFESFSLVNELIKNKIEV